MNPNERCQRDSNPFNFSSLKDHEPAVMSTHYEQITIRVPPATAEKLRDFAHDWEWTHSDVVEAALDALDGSLSPKRVHGWILDMFAQRERRLAKPRQTALLITLLGSTEAAFKFEERIGHRTIFYEAEIDAEGFWHPIDGSPFKPHCIYFVTGNSAQYCMLNEDNELDDVSDVLSDWLKL